MLTSSTSGIAARVGMRLRLDMAAAGACIVKAARALPRCCPAAAHCHQAWRRASADMGLRLDMAAAGVRSALAGRPPAPRASKIYAASSMPQADRRRLCTSSQFTVKLNIQASTVRAARCLPAAPRAGVRAGVAAMPPAAAACRCPKFPPPLPQPEVTGVFGLLCGTHIQSIEIYSQSI